MKQAAVWVPRMPPQPKYFVYDCRHCGNELVFMLPFEHWDFRICPACLDTILGSGQVTRETDRACLLHLIEVQRERRQAMIPHPGRQ